MSHAPKFMDKDFGGGMSGGECWWVWIDDHRISVKDAKQWMDDNGVGHFIFGDRHFSIGTGLEGDERFTRWVGFVFEDDALFFYLAHG